MRLYSPEDGLAKISKELIRTRHYGNPNCLPMEYIFPPGTSFPRYGLCLPDETECMYNQEGCQ